MEIWIDIFIRSLEISALLYLVMVLVFNFGWFRLKEYQIKGLSLSNKLSVIIAFRNEEKQVETLLNSINSQTLDKSQFEVILINDHSTDNSIKIIEQFINKHNNLNIKVLNSSAEGKKGAIKTGLSEVKNDIIFTTDADCIIEENTFKIYLDFFEHNKEIKLAFGPVFYSPESGLKRLFSLEFLSLVSSGAASAGANLPFMANAANMAFRKEAYQKVERKIKSTKLASGDDVFLVHAMAKHFGNKSISFIKNNLLKTETPGPQNLKDFLFQRIRWGAKANSYKNYWSILVALVVFVFNLLLFITFVSGFYTSWFFAVFVLFVLLKFLIDLPLLRNFSNFYRLQKNYYFALPLEFIYPFYIVFTALYPLFFKYNWKGRSHSK